MKKLIYFLIVILLAVGAFIFFKEKANAPQDMVSESPTESATPTPSPTSDGKPNITVTSPKSGDTVTNPITVTGTSRVFSNQFAYILRDSAGKKLVEGNTMSDAKDSGQFGNYTVKIAVPVGATKDLTVEVFEYSAKDGAVVNLVSVPVKM